MQSQGLALLLILSIARCKVLAYNDSVLHEA